MNTHLKLYWISQIGGWAFYLLANWFILLLNHSNNNENINFFSYIQIALISFCGLFLSHGYRYFIKYRKWKHLPLLELIPRVLVASISLALLLLIIIFIFNLFILRSGIISNHSNNIAVSEQINLSAIFGNLFAFLFNISAVFLLWSLIYFGIHYFENYKKAEIESLRTEAALKVFELNTLKSQINPHFMFNALNSIRALVLENPTQAQEAITQLSNILRSSLQLNQRQFIPLEHELATIQDYLSIESIRYEERLQLEYEIQPETLRFMIPPMILLTLVENGIKHGIANQINGGKLKIQTSINAGNLIIEVKNTGTLNKEIETIRSSPAIYNPANGGYGLLNTKQRLFLLYGDKASFEIKNQQPNNVVATIKIPTG